MLGRLEGLRSHAAQGLRAFPRFLSQPILAAVLASGLTALLLAGPPEVQTIREVKVVERIPGRTEYVTISRSVCDTATVAKLLNEVINSSARTGTASFDNESASSVSTPGGGAHASGDNAAAVSQEATASSGDAVAGVVLDLVNVCGKANVTVSNHVEDAKLVTGDAAVLNEAQVRIVYVTPKPTPSPTPETVELLTSPSPTPSPVLSPVVPGPT